MVNKAAVAVTGVNALLAATYASPGFPASHVAAFNLANTAVRLRFASTAVSAYAVLFINIIATGSRPSILGSCM